MAYFTFHGGVQKTCLNPQALVVLLHGYGMSGALFEPLLEQFDLPNVHFWCPDGLEPCQEFPGGRQWFSMAESFWTFDETSPNHGWQAFNDAWPTFSARLEQSADQIVQQIQQGLNGFRGPVILGGFSQGCGTSLYLGMYKMKVAAVLGFSGMYLLPQDPPVYQPPMLWCHGDADTVVHVDWMRQAQKVFMARGLPLETHILKDLPHKLSSQGVAIAREFIIRQVTQF